MDVYIIILNYINYHDTVRLVQQLKNQKSITLKIIIVDNLSPNESFKVLQESFTNDHSVTVLSSEKNGGYSYGNNYGLKYIKQFSPNFVVILNNDLLISDELLIALLIKELNKNKKALLCSPTMLINGKEQDNAWKIPTIWDDIKRATRMGQVLFSNKIEYNFPNERKTEEVECVPGSFFLCNYTKFEEMGFFDEDIFLFGEETILAQKIKQAGGVNLLCRQFNFDHLWSKSINKQITKVKRIELQLLGREIFHKKYNNTNSVLFIFLKVLHKIRIIEEKFRLVLIGLKR